MEFCHSRRSFAALSTLSFRWKTTRASVHQRACRCDVMFRATFRLLIRECRWCELREVGADRAVEICRSYVCYGVEACIRAVTEEVMVGTGAKLAALMSHWPLRSISSELVRRKSTPRIGWKTKREWPDLQQVVKRGERFKDTDNAVIDHSKSWIMTPRKTPTCHHRCCWTEPQLVQTERSIGQANGQLPASWSRRVR